MKIKLTTPERNFVPDVEFPTEEGGRVLNRELSSEDHVTCELKLASVGEKSRYLGSYTVGTKTDILMGHVKQYSELQYTKCVRKHVLKVKGLEDFGITDGKSLVSHDPTPELNDIIKECFFKINGVHADDMGLPDSDTSELTSPE